MHPQTPCCLTFTGCCHFTQKFPDCPLSLNNLKSITQIEKLLSTSLFQILLTYLPQNFNLKLLVILQKNLFLWTLLQELHNLLNPANIFKEFFSASLTHSPDTYNSEIIPNFRIWHGRKMREFFHQTFPFNSAKSKSHFTHVFLNFRPVSLFFLNSLFVTCLLLTWKIPIWMHSSLLMHSWSRSLHFLLLT